VTQPIQIRFGGYGPPTTSFSRALKYIGDKLEAQFGDAVDIKYVWNVMDLGFQGKDILWLAEHGLLTVVYQSTSYLTERVPELGFVDLPFLFDSNEHARGAMDGALGRHLSHKTEERINYKVLGYFENGFRHISNRLRPVRTPADLKDMRIRVLPSEIQARTFELLGAVPLQWDLTEAIDAIVAGTIDAQENPFANTVTYGVHNFHPYHTMSGHFYISRGIFANRTAFYTWPEELKLAMDAAVKEAVAIQRKEAEAEVIASREAIEEAGCEIAELTDTERAAFMDAVKPMHDEARAKFGDEMFGLLKKGIRT